MPAKVFLDTNIIIYCYSQSEPDKQQIAIDCLQSGNPWVSTQVLNETINTLKRKFSLDYIQIGAAIEELKQQIQVAMASTSTIQLALAIAQKYQYSYFDSLIVASALEIGCDHLYSEDMQDGQKINNQLRELQEKMPRYDQQNPWAGKHLGELDSFDIPDFTTFYGDCNGSIILWGSLSRESRMFFGAYKAIERDQSDRCWWYIAPLYERFGARSR